MIKKMFVAAAAAMCIVSVPLVAAELKAGAAKVDITPDEAVFPVTGHVNFTGIHDKLYARALIISDGTATAAFVVLDEGSVPDPARTLTIISDASGIPPTNIILSASHTHNVIMSNAFGNSDPAIQREIEHIQQGASKALQLAKSDMKSASIAFGRTAAYVNTNNGELAGSGNEYDPSGISDKTLDVIRITGIDGKNIALLINYASHAEVMFKSVTKDGGSEISGDLPGATARYLESSEQGAPVVLYTAGAEGDQLPLFKSVQMSAELGTVDEGTGGWTLLDVQARRIASAVLTELYSMKTGTASAVISAKSSSVSVPGQKISIDRTNGKAAVTPTADVVIPISVIKIGNIAFVAAGGDIASSIGIAIRNASPVRNTVFITMLAGSVGYILDDKSYGHPGHGAAGSPVKPGYAQKAISGAINKMLGSKQ